MISKKKFGIINEMDFIKLSGNLKELRSVLPVLSRQLQTSNELLLRKNVKDS